MRGSGAGRGRRSAISGQLIDSLLCQRLRQIRRIALGIMIICPVHAEIGKQLLHPRTLRV